MASIAAAFPGQIAAGRSVRAAARWLGLPAMQVMFGIGLAFLAQFEDRQPLHSVLVVIVVVAIGYHVRNLVDRRRLLEGEADAEVRLAEAEAQLRDLVERLPAAVYRDRYSAEDGSFLAVDYVSPQMETLTGYPASAFTDDGELWTRLVHPDDRDRVFSVNVHRIGNDAIEHEYRIVRRDGSTIWVREEARVLTVPGSSTIVTHGILTDITDRKLLERELNILAFHDPLTGLANRALFEDRLDHALAQRRTSPIAVLFLDLDAFKGINDSLGHAAGDRLLRVIARRLTKSIRVGDTVARLGGDEFAVLAEVASAADAVKAADRLLDALRQPIELEGRQISGQASLGIALSFDGATPTELLRNADAAMYRAKAQRRGGSMLFEPGIHAEALERFDLENDLRRAIDRGELHLAYQPLQSLRDGKADGAEALMRWTHPERGAIPPSVFIPIAEDSELILELGRWALEVACGQLAAWRASGAVEPGFVVSVNVSARQLTENLPLIVHEVLTATGLPAANLTIEITESAVIHDTGAAIETLSAVRALGVSVAMDDFGTGYSSLSHLRSLPIDIVKIDRSFVAGVDRAVEAALIKAVVEVASVLWLRTVAEGVETEDQATRLTELGCDFGQGYLFGRPVRAEEFVARRLQAA
jgi:diguanylate cyclase (GGDEF)-like protein/PAS domain S-box-containing protein